MAITTPPHAYVVMSWHTRRTTSGILLFWDTPAAGRTTGWCPLYTGGGWRGLGSLQQNTHCPACARCSHALPWGWPLAQAAARPARARTSTCSARVERVLPHTKPTGAAAITTEARHVHKCHKPITARGPVPRRCALHRAQTVKEPRPRPAAGGRRAAARPLAQGCPGGPTGACAVRPAPGM